MEAKDELVEQLRKLESLFKSVPWMNSNHSTIKIGAGGIGVWLAMMFALLTLMSAMYEMHYQDREISDMRSDQKAIIQKQDQDIERMQDYLNNIYQQAPWLRPKEKK